MENRDNVISAVKLITTSIVGMGITVLCGAFAGNVASSAKAGFIKKTLMAIGGTVIGSMVANQAETYVNDSIDHVVKQIDDISGFVKNNLTEEAAPEA